MAKVTLSIPIFFFAAGIGFGSAECPLVTTQENFSLSSYISDKWYIHQQAPVEYVPVELNYCVKAEYTLRDRPTFLNGYTIDVSNYAENKEGESFGGPLCAAADSKSNDPAKLVVAPCLVPRMFAGPYWVIAYDEEKGYALVSGGQPTIETENGCKAGDGINNSGLWIFLRTRERNDALIQEARAIASKKGFDLTILNNVDQTNCDAMSSYQS